MQQAVSDFATHLRDDSQVGIVLFDQRVEPVLGLTEGVRCVLPVQPFREP